MKAQTSRVVDAASIEAATSVIDPIFLNTPMLRDTSLDRELGATLSLKVETLNPIRSFKGRGTEVYLSDFRGPTVVCASAGNFGQGIAWSGRKRGVSVIVFCARDANPLKIEAMRRFDADVRLVGRDFDEAKEEARDFAANQGLAFVEDGAEPAVSIGAGTIAREITEAGELPDAILVPVGDGALAAGIGTWMRHASPKTQIIGVVASGAPAMRLSFLANKPVSTPTADTIADGISVRDPVAVSVAGMHATIDRMEEVSDAAMIEAMRLAHQHLGLVVEPAGAAGLALLVTNPAEWRSKKTATVLCGGNADPRQLRLWLG